MSQVCIRAAAPSDVALILQLIGELAEYERLAHEVVATPAALARDLFGPRPAAEVLIAERDGWALGFALFFQNYSTFLAQPGLYLEDLFVRPAARRGGVGKALLAHIARLAVERDCGRFEWSVLDWNKPAIAFYESLGARGLHDWTVHRLAGEALRRLAALAELPR